MSYCPSPTLCPEADISEKKKLATHTWMLWSCMYQKAANKTSASGDILTNQAAFTDESIYEPLVQLHQNKNTAVPFVVWGFLHWETEMDSVSVLLCQTSAACKCSQSSWSRHHCTQSQLFWACCSLQPLFSIMWLWHYRKACVPLTNQTHTVYLKLKCGTSRVLRLRKLTVLFSFFHKRAALSFSVSSEKACHMLDAWNLTAVVLVETLQKTIQSVYADIYPQLL